MANIKLRKLHLNNLNYEVCDWYGVCFTNGSIQTKTVSISDFTSDSLVDGVRVVVRFVYAQNYNGTPFLNVASTGAKSIQSSAGTSALQYEWFAGQIVSFVYYNNVWVIEGGAHADTIYFGKTKLSNTISNNQSTALTPKAVYDAGYVNASGAAAAAPVQSVNGQTGAVSLTIPTVPTNVSAFNNDAGYLTLADLPIWDGSVTP